jgi:hypothetical protein
MRNDRMRRLGLAIMLGASLAAPAWAQEPSQADAGPPVDPSPLSLDKIRAGLAHQPVIVFDAQPTFRSGVSEHRPGYFDLAPQFELPKEAPTWNTGWHNEFLTMVTPPEFRLWQAFTGNELLQVAGLTFVESGLASLAGDGLKAMADARQRSRENAARREVDDALSEFLAGKVGVPQVVTR